MVVPHQDGISGGRVFNTELARALRASGRRVEERTVAGSWPWPTARDRAAVGQAIAIRESDRGDVVLIDGLVGSACPAEIEAAVSSGVRVVLLIHLPLPGELGLTDREQHELAAAEARAVQAVSAVTTTSHWAAEDLRRRYDRPADGVLVPGATPADPATGSQPPLILMLAAFTPVKNHKTLLAALAQLADRPWQARLVGAGRDDFVVDGVRRVVHGAGLRSRIELPGELGGTALERLWRATDLLVLPSVTETYGLVVTEGLAHGVPAVVSRGTGAVEALAGEPGQVAEGSLAGATADPADPGAWARILRQWLDDETLRATWRTRALQRRATLRTWADTANDLAHVLGRLT